MYTRVFKRTTRRYYVYYYSVNFVLVSRNYSIIVFSWRKLRNTIIVTRGIKHSTTNCYYCRRFIFIGFRWGNIIFFFFLTCQRTWAFRFRRRILYRMVLYCAGNSRARWKNLEETSLTRNPEWTCRTWKTWRLSSANPGINIYGTYHHGQKPDTSFPS